MGALPTALKNSVKGVFMDIFELKLSEITPYENNPRKNDEAVKLVAKSIEEFGFKVPIVVDKDGIIIAGHTRYKAAKKLGLEVVPVIRADDLSEEQVKAFRLADNKAAEVAEWDLEKLAEELQDIAEIDMDDFGFDMTAFNNEEPASAEEDDFDVDAPVNEHGVERGQIWQCGQHRVMCGDSTSAEDVARLMGGELADLLLTDPPYNIDYEGKTKEKLTIDNDAWEDEDDFIEFLTQVFEAGLGAMKDGATFYIWYADTQALNFRLAAKKAGMQVRQNLIWVKNVFTLGRQDYQWRHEPCLYGWKDGAAHKWYGDRTQTTCLEFDRPTKSELHPTMKPIPLFSYQIEQSSAVGQNVLDLFGGSGSTLICCEQLNRRSFSMELDTHYVDVILTRWEKLTGEQAQLIEE